MRKTMWWHPLLSWKIVATSICTLRSPRCLDLRIMGEDHLVPVPLAVIFHLPAEFMVAEEEDSDIRLQIILGPNLL